MAKFKDLDPGQKQCLVGHVLALSMANERLSKLDKMPLNKMIALLEWMADNELKTMTKAELDCHIKKLDEVADAYIEEKK